MTKTSGGNAKNGYFWIIFFAFAIFVYFFGLTIPLVGPDEPRYAQVAREMFERGDWITPTLGGFHWFEKPALLYWLQIASYHLFGVSEFAARFGSAVFGLGTVASLWILGRFFATENTEVESSATSTANSTSSVAKDFANWLALIAASTIGIIVFSRGASFDIILTFPMTAALVSFFIFDLAQRYGATKTRKLLSLSAFYFFIGVSVLAKGLIGIVFPFAIVGFYYLLSLKFPVKTFLVSLLWGIPLATIVAAAWYLPMYLTHGYAFIDEFFIQHHFQRYTSNKYRHPQPFYFFFWVLPLMTIPWLPFFIVSVWSFVKGLFYRENAELQTKRSVGFSETGLPFSFSPLLLFSISWLTVPLVFFSFSGSKLPGYILPSVPAAIILTAVYVWRFVRKSRKRAIAIKVIAIATLAFVTAASIFLAPPFAETDSVKSLITEADNRGYNDLKILMLHQISHNAEFYAAGRIDRTDDGAQEKLLGPAHVLREVRENGGSPVLVLVPLEYLNQLTSAPYLKSEVLKDNGELAIVHVGES